MHSSKSAKKRAVAARAAASAETPALPRSLKRLAGRTEVLARPKVSEVLAASTSHRKSSAAAAAVAAATATRTATVTGDALPRDSIAALYGLATRLHSPSLVYHAKSIETSSAKHVTAEQIWGQMSVLLRPVLRRLQDNVRRAERIYGNGAGKRSGAAATATTTTAKAAAALRGQQGDAEAASLQDENEVHLDRASDLSESDLDEAIAGLLAEQKRRRETKAGKRGSAANDSGGGGDAWRYAFGKGGEESDDDDDIEGADGADGGAGAMDEDWGDGEAAMLGSDGEEDPRGGGRARDRNARAMREATDENEYDEGEGDDDDGAKAEEELAALKEMYGEDFEDDGEGLAGGQEEDPDLERDLYYDDPNRGGSGEDDFFDEGEDRMYNEARDGARFWGKDDILNEDQALHSYGGGADGKSDAADGAADPTQIGGAGESEEPYDEEFERALADPNLTELERERLREKKHIEHLEQKRLFGTDWTMAGETAARRRPREALLDVDDLEFDYGMKSVPVITEAFTGKLEDRIKQRILAKNFDDVQRRTAFSTADDLVTTRKDATIDSEKSKLSLMDLYEKEFMDKLKLAEEAAGAGAAAAEPLTEIERDELRAMNMWKRLSQHLDALSNFYYTPKPIQQDLDARVRAVDGAAPAIAIETVGNFATSRESALAPQDLYRGSNRRFADVGSAELLPEERRALRRAKKEEGKRFNERKEHRKRTQAHAREAVKHAKAAA